MKQQSEALVKHDVNKIKYEVKHDVNEVEYELKQRSEGTRGMKRSKWNKKNKAWSEARSMKHEMLWNKGKFKII